MPTAPRRTRHRPGEIRAACVFGAARQGRLVQTLRRAPTRGDPGRPGAIGCARPPYGVTSRNL